MNHILSNSEKHKNICWSNGRLCWQLLQKVLDIEYEITQSLTLRTASIYSMKLAVGPFELARGLCGRQICQLSINESRRRDRTCWQGHNGDALAFAFSGLIIVKHSTSNI